MQSDDDMVNAVEQWLHDNPPLTNAALRAEIARLTEALRAAEEREKALREAALCLRQLIGPDNSRVYASDPQVAALDAALKDQPHADA